MSLFISLLLLQAAATAPAPTTQQLTAPADDKKVCKTLRASGSRLGGTRMCLSKESWRQFEESRQATRFKKDRQPKEAASQ